MDIVYFFILIALLLCVLLLVIKQYSLKKRISDMTTIMTSIIAGENKRQIYSKKQDELGKLAFEINRLSLLYGTTEDKYEKEQLTKKQLISNLSHDVRTPLVSVLGYLEAVVQERVPDNQREDYINTAYQKAVLLKEQINQLFEFVQNDANEIQLSMTTVDVCELTRQVIIDFLPTIEKEHIELVTSIPDDEINISADTDGFKRIVQNLVKNTITHAGDGKYLGITIRKDFGKVYIDIADKGEGIHQDQQPYVFERLYKADTARTRGGGIGLAIAKELSNKMNGNIEILRSIPGDTVFRVTFTEMN